MPPKKFHLELQLSEEERNQLTTILDSTTAFKSDAEIIRHCIMQVAPHLAPQFTPLDPALIRELKAIGNNLNQLTHQVNRRAKQGYQFETLVVYQALILLYEQMDQFITRHTE